jgi:hypothetical protein
VRVFARRDRADSRLRRWLIAQCDPAWLPARELWFAEQVARLLAPEL